MENVISALLRDFEQGKTTRRQLIQNLSMAAVAAPAAVLVGSQTAPVASGGKAPWKTVWLDHISYSVAVNCSLKGNP